MVSSMVQAMSCTTMPANSTVQKMANLSVISGAIKLPGIFQNTQEIDEWRAAGNGILQSNVQPGDVRFVDRNHDGQINDKDKVNLGNSTPDFTLGLNLGFVQRLRFLHRGKRRLWPADCAVLP